MSILIMTTVAHILERMAFTAALVGYYIRLNTSPGVFLHGRRNYTMIPRQKGKRLWPTVLI